MSNNIQPAKPTSARFAVAIGALILLLTVAPLIVKAGAEFGGADGEATAVIETIAPDYEPWFDPIFEPASGEIESLLFCSQAAFGAGILGYGLAYLKYGARKKDDE